MITISMMSRRDFVLQALAATIAPSAMAEDERKYESPTLSVQLAEEEPGVTVVVLTEHGDADYAVVEAFYQATHLVLSKTVVCPLIKGTSTAVDIYLPLATITFIRVKEMHLLREAEFGRAKP